MWKRVLGLLIALLVAGMVGDENPAQAVGTPPSVQENSDSVQFDILEIRDRKVYYSLKYTPLVAHCSNCQFYLSWVSLGPNGEIYDRMRFANYGLMPDLMPDVPLDFDSWVDFSWYKEVPTKASITINIDGRNAFHEDYLLDPAGPGADILILAAPALLSMFAPEEICFALNEAPGATHFRGGTVSDQYLDCEMILRGGGTTASIVTTILTWDRGSSFARHVLADLRPAPAKPKRSRDPKREELERAYAIPEIVLSLKGRLSTRSVTKSELQIAARGCANSVSLAGRNPEECATRHVFISGSNVKEATKHDIAALKSYPQWVGQNYEDKGVKKAWYAADPRCRGASAKSKKDCDEFPLWTTEQGGPLAKPKPSLRVIHRSDNRAQGAYFMIFKNKCGLMTGERANDPASHNSTGGTPFFFVATTKVKTVGFCA